VATGLWQPLGVPGGFAEIWRQDLHSIAELVHLRARLRAELTGSASVVHPEREHWSERLVLITDELASNALRHGGAPVRAALSRSGADWLITVTDSAAGIPPQPAQNRDPSRGGFGLYLVADLAQRHGWHSRHREKIVWAVLSSTNTNSAHPAKPTAGI
jgi:two-component sensor histidine kinase